MCVICDNRTFILRQRQLCAQEVCAAHQCIHEPALQALPAGVRAKCEDPTSSYNFGWSHGKEALVGGRPDVHKGSYYANPLNDEVTADEDLMRQYPSYCRCSTGRTTEQVVFHHDQMTRRCSISMSC